MGAVVLLGLVGSLAYYPRSTYENITLQSISVDMHKRAELFSLSTELSLDSRLPPVSEVPLHKTTVSKEHCGQGLSIRNACWKS